MRAAVSVGTSGRGLARTRRKPCDCADHAVFGGGAGINRDRQTRTGVEVVAETVALAGVAAIERLTVDAAVERGVDAQITTQLDAGVGARDIEETRAIQGADPHVLDRFGLDGKIGRLSS